MNITVEFTPLSVNVRTIPSAPIKRRIRCVDNTRTNSNVRRKLVFRPITSRNENPSIRKWPWIQIYQVIIDLYYDGNRVPRQNPVTYVSPTSEKKIREWIYNEWDKVIIAVSDKKNMILKEEYRNHMEQLINSNCVQDELRWYMS